jgi:hypothetical protein
VISFFLTTSHYQLATNRCQTFTLRQLSSRVRHSRLTRCPAGSDILAPPVVQRVRHSRTPSLSSSVRHSLSHSISCPAGSDIRSTPVVQRCQTSLHPLSSGVRHSRYPLSSSVTDIHAPPRCPAVSDIRTPSRFTRCPAVSDIRTPSLSSGVRHSRHCSAKLVISKRIY